MLRNYEIAVIFHPELDEAALAAQVERVEQWIAADGGSVVRTERWGKRRLAYEIRKRREGYYIFWYASLPPELPQEIERNLRLSEEVMRFMVTRLEAVPEPAAKALPASKPVPEADAELDVDDEELEDEDEDEYEEEDDEDE